MAKRFVYFNNNKGEFLKEEIEFEWVPGMALSQKQKCSISLREAIHKRFPNLKVLEVSSASENPLGIKLSAFNLKLKTSEGSYTVEQIFQAAKVFKRAGRQSKLLGAKSKDAKINNRKVQENDELIAFEIFGKAFPTKPKTFFYNYIYVNALFRHEELNKTLLNYDAFTDIRFDPKKQVNCQAEACSIYRSLKVRGLLERAIKSPDNFLEIVYPNASDEDSNDNFEQLSLF